VSPSVNGLASGIDTDAVITQLLSLERVPRTRIELRQTAAQARQDGLQAVSSRLGALRTAAAALGSAGTWAEVQTVESSASGTVGARLTAGAAPGGSVVTVTSLASAAQRSYDFTPQAGASSLTIGGTTVALAAGASLADAVSAINAQPATGVFAVDVGGKLLLASRTTGAASTAAATGAGVSEVVGSFRAGTDAAFDVGGTGYTRSSNVVTDVLAGVELTLKAPGTAAVSVSAPQADQTAVLDKAKAFVKAYNDLQGFVRDALAEKKVPGAASTADAKKGALRGDPTLRAALDALRSAAGTFSDLGISTGAATAGSASSEAVKGTLVLDEGVFRAALSADPAAARTRLGALASGMEAVIAPLADAGGTLDQRVGAARSEVSRLGANLATFDERLSRREALLRRQFTAMELALSRNQSTSADLASRLGG
jgi:flagellar hook-associated protein 2